MENLRLTKLELKVNEHNRRLEDQEFFRVNAEKRMDGAEKRIDEDRVDIEMLKQILFVQQKQFEAQLKTNEGVNYLGAVAKETLDVVRPLMKALRIVGIAATWSAKVAVGVTVVWNVAKLVAAKIALVWP